jgi:hypothetical protein
VQVHQEEQEVWVEAAQEDNQEEGHGQEQSSPLVLALLGKPSLSVLTGLA